MSDLDPRFIEDRALRNAARSVIQADIEHARESFTPGNIAAQVGSRIAEGAEEVAGIAKDRADDNRGVIAILLGALFLFIARRPILEILGLSEAENEDEHDTDAPEEESGAAID